jgi:hypothetical protein
LPFSIFPTLTAQQLPFRHSPTSVMKVMTIPQAPGPRLQLQVQGCKKVRDCRRSAWRYTRGSRAGRTCSAAFLPPPDRAGAGRAGPDRAGPGLAWPNRARSSRASRDPLSTSAPVGWGEVGFGLGVVGFGGLGWVWCFGLGWVWVELGGVE